MRVFLSFFLLSIAVLGVDSRVGRDEKRHQTYQLGKFSIRSLDDPRLKNPWASLPYLLPKNATATTKNRKLDSSLRDEPNEYPDKPKMVQYEYWEVVIIGAGPGGITAAKTILDASPNAKVLILEKGPPLEAYVAKGYDNALQHGVATADPDFREDVEGTPIVLGTGVGGGTL